MIIWIASYPKSGNTWVRALLSTYLYSEHGNCNFKILNKIKQFPSSFYLDFFLKELNDIKKVSNYWLAAQERINLNNQNILLKTHSALCTLENNPFTDKSNTAGAIYVVRDPRNIVTSISHHYSLSIGDSVKFIMKKKNMLVGEKYGKNNSGIAQILGDWSSHYRSWRDLKFAPILIIKYEDLLIDTRETFLKILKFLNMFMKIEKDEKKIQNTIESCSFENLSKKEQEEGFLEAAVSKKNNKNLKFFYLGKKNNWKNFLSKEIENNIKENFKNEMKELHYI